MVASALPAQVQDFGTKKVGDVVTFHVPPNTGSITIVHQAQLANLTVVYQNALIDNSAVPLTITKPDGGLAYDDANPGPAYQPSPDGGLDPSGEYAFYAGGTPSTAAFTIPNTTASLSEGVPPGDWKLVVNDYANECTFLTGCSDGGTSANQYGISVLTRPLPQGSTLNASFYIVADLTSTTGTPLDATNASTDPAVKRMVQAYKDIFSAAGINASATFYYARQSDRQRFGTNINADLTGPCDELSQMFTLSKEHPGNSMNVFLVNSLRSASHNGTQVVGIDGTIPGPSSYNGTVHSGAVVSAADLFSGWPQACPATGTDIQHCGPDRIAYIAAHESGHFLGLVHTTEAEGTNFDPLSDTAKCPCLSCAAAADRATCTSNSPTASLFNNLCSGSPAGCGGGDNLMFWFLQAGYSKGIISPQQAQVMRLNPLMQ